MTAVSVNTYTHSVTYVTDNILKSLKDVIKLSGLDPAAFTAKWATYELALKTWLDGKWLEKVVLEIYDPKTDKLATRWDIDISYGWTGDGTFYTDTDQLRYAIKKLGLAPEKAQYRIVMDTKAGSPSVPGWSSTKYRSTVGMVRQSLGSTVEHSGLGGGAAYWRRA